jgi:hypothetical protein
MRAFIIGEITKGWSYTIYHGLNTKISNFKDE